MHVLRVHSQAWRQGGLPGIQGEDGRSLLMQVGYGLCLCPGWAGGMNGYEAGAKGREGGGNGHGMKQNDSRREEMIMRVVRGRAA